MPTDFDGREPDTSPSGADSPLFASQPIWERDRKRRGFGGRKTAAPAPPSEPRGASWEEPAMTLDRPMERPATVTNTTLAADEPRAAPRGRSVRSSRAKASSGASPAMIAGGVAALLAVGAGGWYLTRPHDGVPDLAPGRPTTSELATAPLTPVPPDVDAKTNPLPMRAEATPEASPPPAERRVAQARVRPAARAAAPSADAASSNASATLPDGPQPYSTLNPAAPPTQVTPPAPPPAEAAPPAAIPQAPPPTETPPPTPPSA